MPRSLFTAASGMQVQQTNVDNIANNLANASTVGYKRSRVEFQDILYQNLRSSGAASSTSTNYPVGLQVGLGARAVSTERIFTQGDFRQTENPLDMVIAGKGFFQVRQPSGEIAYTRAGSFHMDANGQVVTADGFALDPQIQIPSEALAITIGADGTVSVKLAGQAESSQVGQIQLVNFANPSGLEAIGRNLFTQTSASGQPLVGTPGQNSLGTIEQGYVEQSNVSIVEELVNMILAQRAYETNSRVVRTSDEMMQIINNVR